MGTDGERYRLMAARKRFNSTVFCLVIGLVLGGIVTTTGALSSDDSAHKDLTYPSASDLEKMPAGKQAAIERERSEGGELVELGNPTVPRWEDFADSGDPKSVESVRAAIPVLEVARSNGFAMPAADQRRSAASVSDEVIKAGRLTTSDREQAAAVGKSDPTRRAVESRAAEALAASNVYDSEEERDADIEAVVTAYDDPTFAGYTESRFVVDRWLGIEVTGSSARALLEAHQEYNRNADPLGVVPHGWVKDPVRRWQVELQLTTDGWKISAQSQHELDAPVAGED